MLVRERSPRKANWFFPRSAVHPPPVLRGSGSFPPSPAPFGPKARTTGEMKSTLETKGISVFVFPQKSPHIHAPTPPSRRTFGPPPFRFLPSLRSGFEIPSPPPPSLQWLPLDGPFLSPRFFHFRIRCPMHVGLFAGLARGKWGQGFPRRGIIQPGGSSKMGTSFQNPNFGRASRVPPTTLSPHPPSVLMTIINREMGGVCSLHIAPFCFTLIFSSP